MIRLRISYSIILAFLLSVFNVTTIPVAWAIVGLFELVMGILTFVAIQDTDEIAVLSWRGVLLYQYAVGSDINFIEIANFIGARVLASLLGFYEVWFYIPSVILFLLTCIDFKKKEKPVD